MTRNIVMVSIDSLRADHCGFMGYERDTTPTLDAMAADGFVFENAIAPAPSTPGSMSATHTGKFLKPYSSDDDAVIVNRRQNINRHMRENPTIAERLSENGYTTIGFSPNPFTSRYFGFGDGFDQYTDFLDDERPFAGVYDRIFRRFISGNTQLTPIRLMLNYLEGEEIFKSWEQYYDDVVESVQSASEPYFLWVFLLDTHLPYFVEKSRRDGVSWLDMWRYNLRLYRSDPEFSECELEDLVSLYDSTIRRVDDFVARLTDDLSDPVYFIHSDHGEAFGEHGMYGHEPYAYEENVHVPYIVANSDWSGTRSSPVSLRQIPSHIWSHAGLTDQAASAPGETETRFNALTNPFGARSAVRTEEWKYIWRPSAAAEEVYALSDDPSERNDLVEDRTDPVDLLRRLADYRMDVEREQLGISNGIENATEGADL